MSAARSLDHMTRPSDCLHLRLQPALVAAQSPLAEEEEEAKHAGHLRVPQEPQPDVWPGV